MAHVFGSSFGHRPAPRSYRDEAPSPIHGLRVADPALVEGLERFAGKSSFLASILSQAHTRQLSGKQVTAAREVIAKLARSAAPDIGKAPAVADAPPQLTINAQRIFELFAVAKTNGAKYPKIRLQTNEQPPVAVVMSQAGPRSQYAGQVMITNGEAFGSPLNRFFGRIDQSGVFHEGRHVTDAVRATLRNMADDPARAAMEYGKLTDHCCFCAKRLTDGRSILAGYGPQCADKFGLAWGDGQDEDAK